jgi:hypothetical protein
LVIEKLGSRLRGLLRRPRPRATPRRGAKPAIGAHIVREDVRMTIQAGMSDQLWSWLQDQGWRESTFQPDRRRYRDIPSAWVTRLIDAPPDRCARVLDAATEHAVVRPSLRGGAGGGARLPLRRR